MHQLIKWGALSEDVAQFLANLVRARLQYIYIRRNRFRKDYLVNLIPRFYDVREGSILLDGRDVRTWPLRELREKFGVVPQKAVLFKGSLRENMKWGKADASDEEIYQALAIAQARDFVEAKGKG